MSTGTLVSVAVASIVTGYFIYCIWRGSDGKFRFDFQLIKYALGIFIGLFLLGYFIANKPIGSGGGEEGKDYDYCDIFTCRGR